jgi:tetratricopeptide (TPR) repeat protein
LGGRLGPQRGFWRNARRADRTPCGSNGAGGLQEPRASATSQPIEAQLPELSTFDEQQQRLLRILERAGGAPVGYETLRGAGIEFPAGVVAELELLGVAIERCTDVHYGGRPVASVRLRPGHIFTVPAQSPHGEGTRGEAHRRPRAGSTDPTVEADQWNAPSPARRSAPPLVPWHSRIPHGAWIAVAFVALVAALALLGALARGGRPGERAVAPHPQVQRHTTQTHSTAPARHHPAASRALPLPPQPPVSPVSAMALEAAGHGLLDQGRYLDAVPLLRRAIAATGEDLQDCLYPASTSCLTYAYALYDLGDALALSGDGAAAVPILRERLEINNQRPVVLATLAQAEATPSRPAA